MALGEFTKQLAQQAIGEQMKDLLDPKPAAPAQPDNLCTTILGQIQAMQKVLKEGEELVVLCHAAGESLRVMEFYAPTWNVAVLTGMDANRNITRIISPVESLQLVCKVMKAQGSPAALRIRTPKS
jgi:hypothetical protein